MFNLHKTFSMKKIILALLITASIAACSSNGNTKDSAADTTTTITSGNTNSTQGQDIPRDSIETSSDSTGNIHPGDTTKK